MRGFSFGSAALVKNNTTKADEIRFIVPRLGAFIEASCNCTLFYNFSIFAASE
jgi:hypothetical protein